MSPLGSHGDTAHLELATARRAEHGSRRKTLQSASEFFHSKVSCTNPVSTGNLSPGGQNNMKSGIKMRTKDVKNFIFREKILFLSKVLQLIDRQAEQVEHMLREQIQMKTIT